MSGHIPQHALASDRRANSAGHNDPGHNPPRAAPAPSRTAQKRDNVTHRRTDVRGPHQGRAAKGGLGEKPRGKRLATVKRHRAERIEAAKGLPLHDGGKERVSGIEWRI